MLLQILSLEHELVLPATHWCNKCFLCSEKQILEQLFGTMGFPGCMSGALSGNLMQHSGHPYVMVVVVQINANGNRWQMRYTCISFTSITYAQLM